VLVLARVGAVSDKVVHLSDLSSHFFIKQRSRVPTMCWALPDQYIKWPAFLECTQSVINHECEEVSLGTAGTVMGEGTCGRGSQALLRS
jgi:hypothetical protein